MNFKQATYLNLSRDFYSKLSIKPFDNANVIQWNFALTKELEIPEGFGEDILSFLKGKQSEYFKHVFAQAYAGHQFGHFTMLGDGRTAVLGEWVGNQEAYEIQLKGSGPTPYSRRGDGKANLRAMLREYLISEAMHGLGISTSRSLAIYDSGEKIQRNALEDGAILVRIMKSHLRVGTFEYARYFLDHRALVQLFDFCVDRFYPEVKQEENPVLSFISRVAEKQFDLIAHWMRVGFIHGVMNTDNTAISGETFDYGPCAFMNRYDPMTVYSSIDSQGRYAFGNQPNCIQWNLVRLTEALLPLIATDEKKAISLATSLIESFEGRWKSSYYAMMLEKIGLSTQNTEGIALVDNLVTLMKQHGADYILTFAGLCHPVEPSLTPWEKLEFKAWKARWLQLSDKETTSIANRLKQMQSKNPLFIPRNEWVEKLIDSTTKEHSFSAFHEAAKIFANPFILPKDPSLFIPSSESWEDSYKTYCGT
ncbi:MAG: protein adenylyltransferase SelO [Flavobacteriales bacterium]|jgi:uncharacterized protein YdiU (UPF0061 family)